MLTAESAAARMDRIYGPQRYVYDATRKYYLLGRDRLIAGLQPLPSHRVLEIGCGTGRNLISAARRYPGVALFGIDVSHEMLAVARRAIARRQLTRSVHIAQADATTFEPQVLFRSSAFDRIFLSYTLSMIPAWRQVLERSLNFLAPGGELHVVDFGDQRGLPRWFKRGLEAWLARFHVTPRDGLESAMTELAAARGAGMLFTRPYRGYAQIGVILAPPGRPIDPAVGLQAARGAGAL